MNPIGFVSALWLGILTAISPCPLATNIVAVSYISKKAGSVKHVIASGILYAIGRMLAYAVVAIVIIAGLTSSSDISHFFDKYMNRLLGPILIIVGMFLLEMFKFGVSSGVSGEKMQKIADSWGVFGAFLLGVVFALSFCPVSAALFFGSLISLSIKYKSNILMPSVFGIGTALPVLVFAVLIAFGAKSVGKAYNALSKIEFWFRRITGLIFIIVGIYYCLVYIFGVI